jgi:hypothetical protein
MQVESFVFFVEGLALSRDFDLGNAHFCSQVEGRLRLDELAGKSRTTEFVRGILEEKKLAKHTVVEVRAVDEQTARSHLRECVDVLTALTLRTNNSKHFGHFGLAGDLTSARDDTLHVGDEFVGLGARHVGHIKGLGLSNEEVRALVKSREFEFLHKALRAEERNEGQRRALQGIWYFAMSVRALDDDISVLLASAAIEAWVLQEQEGKTYTAARAVAWFSCLEPGNLCGRDRTPCPYLLLNPANQDDRGRLRVLKALHDEREKVKQAAKKVAGRKVIPVFDGWTCSQWSRGAKWYDLRSEVAHGRVSDDPDAIEDIEEERHNKRFWIATRVLNPVLNWLEDHPDSPARDLASEIAALQKPDNWETIVGLIDRKAFDQPCPYIA